MVTFLPRPHHRQIYAEDLVNLAQIIWRKTIYFGKGVSAEMPRLQYNRKQSPTYDFNYHPTFPLPFPQHKLTGTNTWKSGFQLTFSLVPTSLPTKDDKKSVSPQLFSQTIEALGKEPALPDPQPNR